jgi:hypothetical protein
MGRYVADIEASGTENGEVEAWHLDASLLQMHATIGATSGIVELQRPPHARVSRSLNLLDVQLGVRL